MDAAKTSRCKKKPLRVKSVGCLKILYSGTSKVSREFLLSFINVQRSLIDKFRGKFDRQLGTMFPGTYHRRLCRKLKIKSTYTFFGQLARYYYLYLKQKILRCAVRVFLMVASRVKTFNDKRTNNSTP